MKAIAFIVITILFIALSDAKSLEKKEKKLTLRGRIIFPAGSPVPIESGGQLIVELQDISLADAAAKTITRGIGQAIRFPMAFAMKYSASLISDGRSYSLHVVIKNKNNELLYTNDVNIRVNPTGVRRTTFIDVPVIQVKKTAFIEKKTQWPELIGTDGTEAVKIIKQETGFTNVMTMSEGSPVTLDYRTDRVRVFVDKFGVVISTPTVA